MGKNEEKRKVRGCLLEGAGKQFYRRCLAGMLVLAVLGIGICNIAIWHNHIPSSVLVREGEVSEFDFQVPCMAKVGEQQVSLSQSFTVSASQQKTYEMDVKLFGIIPFKKMEIKTVSAQSLIPGGEPVGVYVETDGIMVLGTTPITNVQGENVEPAKNIIVSGDYIVAVNGTEMHYKSEFLEYIKENGKKPIIVTIRRNDTNMKVRIKPVETKSGRYQCGIWIRDDTQGIGTLTYVKEDGSFGALGHGVSDIDTGTLLESKKGVIYQSKISHIIPSTNGNPGELVGSIDYAYAYQLGAIEKNTDCGIFGTGNANLKSYIAGESIPIALKQEVKLGKAYILSSISGEKKAYEIEIEKCNLADTKNKGMVIAIKDKELLKLAGGIVQGMSGSPIIQDGKLIGAVTHVFVNTPTKGYGVFIENMLEQN